MWARLGDGLDVDLAGGLTWCLHALRAEKKALEKFGSNLFLEQRETRAVVQPVAKNTSPIRRTWYGFTLPHVANQRMSCFFFVVWTLFNWDASETSLTGRCICTFTVDYVRGAALEISSPLLSVSSSRRGPANVQPQQPWIHLQWHPRCVLVIRNAQARVNTGRLFSCNICLLCNKRENKNSLLSVLAGRQKQGPQDDNSQSKECSKVWHKRGKR